jgi:hypothetical protein
MKALMEKGEGLFFNNFRNLRESFYAQDCPNKVCISAVDSE